MSKRTLAIPTSAQMLKSHWEINVFGSRPMNQQENPYFRPQAQELHELRINRLSGRYATNLQCLGVSGIALGSRPSASRLLGMFPDVPVAWSSIPWSANGFFADYLVQIFHFL